VLWSWLALAPAGSAAAAAGALDGKSYRGLLFPAFLDGHVDEEKNAKEDSLTFASGKLSYAGPSWKLQPSDYTAREIEDGFAFTSTSHDDSGATVEWEGTVRGEKLEARATRTGGDQKKEYVFRGRIVR
jgi:hypothetical protein